MLRSVPLLILPFLLFNLGITGLLGADGGDPWAGHVASLPMVKSTRTSNASVLDHILSVFVFVAFLVEFLLVPAAAHPVFFTLMVIALVDVLAGFSVSLRAAGRDVNWN